MEQKNKTFTKDFKMEIKQAASRDNAAYNHPHPQSKHIEETKQVLLKIRIIADAIREAGETGIASGVLYAMVMEKYSLNEYDKIISILVDAKLIENKYHLLKWIGPIL
jgi:hypothetical protein